MTFASISLGCKVNNYETSALKEVFLNNGYKLDNKNPDVFVINTCSVTSVADQKSRQLIRRYRRKFPNSVLVVMGCYSQKNYEYIKENIDADIVVGTSNRNKIYDYVCSYLKNKKQIIEIDPNTRKFKYESFPYFSIPTSTRAYIKIQDGCNNYCAYCTIPDTRGCSRSRDKDEIINEIKLLISKGFKEFVLTGIHVAHYGLDIGLKFSDLVEEIVKLDGLYRLRISSIEESEIDDKLISLLSKYPSIANHLHIPLQSGCSKILKSMRRKYNIDDFYNKIIKIRSVRPDIAITTDVIVGFPDETEEDFLETYNFIKKVNFSELHVFPFSPRENTVAATLPNQIDPKIKNSRVQKLIDLSNKLNNEYLSRFIGQSFDIILEEKEDDGKLSGLTSNYIRIKTNYSKEFIGKVVNIKYDKID